MNVPPVTVAVPVSVPPTIRRPLIVTLFLIMQSPATLTSPSIVIASSVSLPLQ